MSSAQFDINTVRLGHVIRFDFTTEREDERTLTVRLSVVHADLDGRTLRTFGQVELGLPQEGSDYKILASILDVLPPIDARAPDGSRLFAREVRRDGSFVEGADRVQRIWRARASQWTQDATDLQAIRALSSVSFVAL